VSLTFLSVTVLDCLKSFPTSIDDINNEWRQMWAVISTRIGSIFKVNVKFNCLDYSDFPILACYHLRPSTSSHCFRHIFNCLWSSPTTRFALNRIKTVWDDRRRLGMIKDGWIRVGNGGVTDWKNHCHKSEIGSCLCQSKTKFSLFF